MIIVNCDQGSKEWHLERAGVITASMFKTAREKIGSLDEKQAKYVSAIISGKNEKEACQIAGYKAKPKANSVIKALNGEKYEEFSSAAKDYAFGLAVERISGKPLDGGFETWAMRRGHELEPEARFKHEEKIGMLIEHAGLVLTDDKLFGASADGLINDDGGSEYKCLVAPERIRSIVIDSNIDDFKDQVQGCLWLTGRKWWHFCLYCPALKSAGKELTIFKVERDDEYIAAMEADLLEFNRLVEAYKEELLNKVA